MEKKKEKIEREGTFNQRQQLAQISQGEENIIVIVDYYYYYLEGWNTLLGVSAMPQPVVNENEAGVDFVDDEKVKKIENG